MKKYTIKDFLAGKVSVKCENRVQKETLLNVCKENGIVWHNGKAIGNFFPPYPVLTVGFYGDGKLTNGVGNNPCQTVVPFYEIDFHAAPRYQIIIEADGDTTTAKMVVNGKEIKTATAKRNPADKANWRIGAQTAFDRLWQKQPKPEKPAENGGFKVGDRVVCVGENDNPAVAGKHGTVMCIKSIDCIGIKFDEHVDGHGLESAYLRFAIKDGHGWWCNGENLRHEQPTKQKVREVKRQANPGEYIKLVNKRFSFDEIGEILRVDGVHCLGSNGSVAFVIGKNNPAAHKTMPDFDWNYPESDYVVLEGYKPGRDA